MHVFHVVRFSEFLQRVPVALNLPETIFPPAVDLPCGGNRKIVLLFRVLRMLTATAADKSVIFVSSSDYLDKAPRRVTKAERYLTVYEVENRGLPHRVYFLRFQSKKSLSPQLFHLPLAFPLCRDSGLKNNFCCRCSNVSAKRPCTAGNLRCRYHRDL